MDDAPQIHPLACVDPGARIGQFVVILNGAVIGEDCNLNAHVLVEGGAIVGDRVALKSGVSVWDGVSLEDDVFVGPNAVFTDDKTPRSRQRPATWLQTVVGKGASIGGGAIILPGVTISDGAIIGAGAVVTRNVPAGETWIGNPAQRHEPRR